jgi:hypothetical protein
MSYNELPDESKAEIDKIVNKHNANRLEIVERYWKIFNQPMIKSAKGEAAQHEWVNRILKSEFDDRPPIGKKNFVVLGKGPIQYSKKSNSLNSYLLVLDADNREVKTLVFRSKDVQLMDSFQCFDMYKGVLCGSGDDGTLFGDNRMMPVPLGSPTGRTADEMFKAVKVKEVMMANLAQKGNMSAVRSDGWPIRTDIRCFRNCFVIRSYAGVIPEWTKFEVLRANMFLKDDRNDFDEGYTDDDGLEWPNKMTFWCNPEFVQPKDSVVNVWAVVSRHKETKEIGAEIVYADPVFIADDTN